MVLLSIDFTSPPASADTGQPGQWRSLGALNSTIVKYQNVSVHFVTSAPQADHKYEIMWDNGLWLRITKPYNAAVASLGAFVDTAGKVQQNDLSVTVDSDSLSLLQDPNDPLFAGQGWDTPFKGGLVLGARDGTGDESDNETACRTSLQLVYDQDRTNYVIGTLLNAVARTAQRQAFQRLGMIQLPGIQTDSFDFQPPGQRLKMAMSFGTPAVASEFTGLDTQGNAIAPATSLNWQRRFYLPNSVTPFTDIARVGAAIVLAEGQLSLQVRLKSLQISL